MLILMHGSSCTQTPLPSPADLGVGEVACPAAGGGNVTGPPETSEGCEALGNRSEGQSLALREGCSGTAPRSSAYAAAAAARTAPTPAAGPARRRGLVGLLRGGKETKIKKRQQKPALGNE